MEKVRVSCYNRAVLFFYLLKDGVIYKKYLLKLIKEKIGIQLEEAEAGYIALHLVNFQQKIVHKIHLK